MPPVLTEQFFSALASHVLRGQRHAVLDRFNAPLAVYSKSSIHVFEDKESVGGFLAGLQARLANVAVASVEVAGLSSDRSETGAEVHSLELNYRSMLGRLIGSTVCKLFVRRIEGAPIIELIELKASTLPGPGCLSGHGGRRRPREAGRTVRLGLQAPSGRNMSRVSRARPRRTAFGLH